MSDGTKIEWTDATWNVVNGCMVTSPGCTNCYAMKQAHRFEPRRGLSVQSKGGMVWTGEVRFNEKVLLDPIRWKRPRKIFVCAHGDLFYEKVPTRWIDEVFAVMAAAPQHVFQVLTKRPERMREYAYEAMGCGEHWLAHCERSHAPMWPLENVWLGVSTEDQQRAEERIPVLLSTPAAKRWISAEPLLGPIDLSGIITADNWVYQPLKGVRFNPMRPPHYGEEEEETAHLDWVVVGGESGPGARPMHSDWVRGIRDQCAAAGVPFLFKQWGDFVEIDGLRCAGHGHSRIENQDKAFFLKADGTVVRRGDRMFSSCGVYGADSLMLAMPKREAGRLFDGQLHDGYPA